MKKYFFILTVLLYAISSNEKNVMTNLQVKKYILIFLLGLFIFFIIKIFLLNEYVSFKASNKYKIYDDKGRIVNAKIFMVDKNFNNKMIKNQIIICFLDYNPIFRVHVNFEEKLIGTPVYGNRNYQFKNKLLTIFNENLFYKNGLLFHPFLKGIDIDYNFSPNKLVFNSFGKIADKSKFYSLEFQ